MIGSALVLCTFTVWASPLLSVLILNPFLHAYLPVCVWGCSPYCSCRLESHRGYLCPKEQGSVSVKSQETNQQTNHHTPIFLFYDSVVFNGACCLWACSALSVVFSRFLVQVLNIVCFSLPTFSLNRLNIMCVCLCEREERNRLAFSKNDESSRWVYSLCMCRLCMHD